MSKNTTSSVNTSVVPAKAAERLRLAGLRPTQQRLALADLLFGDGVNKHISAEALHEQALGHGLQVSLATVYNTLNHFSAAGLLREIVVDAGKTYFDTNTGTHHHFLLESSGQLMDIPAQQLDLGSVPEAPDGTEIDRVDVIIRLRPTSD